jgi:hypothetical protein
MITIVTVITIIIIIIIESNILIFFLLERLKCRWEDKKKRILLTQGYTTVVRAKKAQRMLRWVTSGYTKGGNFLIR